MIIVCGLNAVQDLVDKHSVGRVVSLLGPDTPHRTFKNIVAERAPEADVSRRGGNDGRLFGAAGNGCGKADRVH